MFAILHKPSGKICEVENGVCFDVYQTVQLAQASIDEMDIQWQGNYEVVPMPSDLVAFVDDSKVVACASPCGDLDCVAQCNNITVAMNKKGNYSIKVWGLEASPSFIVVDSQEGYWTAYNSLAVSVLRAKTKSDILDIFRSASDSDLNQYNYQEQV